MNWLSGFTKATYWFLMAIPSLAKILIKIGSWQRDRDYQSVKEDVNSLRVSMEKMMSVTGILATFDLALDFAGKLMDKLPDYDQRKKEEFYELRTMYREEISKEIFGTRPGMDRDKCQDSNKIANLKAALDEFMKSFHEEIGL